MTSVELFTREGCTLCEKARATILRVRKDTPFSFREVYLVPDSFEEAAYGSEIPVLTVNGRIFSRHTLNEAQFRQYLIMLERKQSNAT